MATEFLSPVGRIVQGNCFTAQTTGKNKQPLVIKTGPNAGQPRVSYFLAVAFAKEIIVDGVAYPNTEFDEFYAQIYDEGRVGYPQHFDAQGNCKHPRFAFKVMDGDGHDDDGFPNWEKPGFAGHWVVKFSNGFAPSCYHMGKYDPAQQITDPNVIKTGYYVRVGGDMSANIGSDVPGVYLNMKLIELCGYGEVINSGPNAAAILGGRPVAALPAGASQVPIGANGPAARPGAPGGPGRPAPAAAVAQRPVAAATPQRAAPGPGAPGRPAPAAAVARAPLRPNQNFVANTLAQQPGPQYIMTELAEGYSRDEYLAQDWTDDDLIAAGKMIIQ